MSYYKAIHRSDLKESFIVSGIMLLYSVIFSLFGMLFLYLKIDGFLHLLIGLAFLIPMMIIYFFEGTREGDREFKKLNYNKLNNSERQSLVKVNIFKGLVYIVPFISFVVLLSGIAWITEVQFLKMLSFMIFMPACKIAQSAGWIVIPHLETIEGVQVIVGNMPGSVTFAVVACYGILSVICFWAGYVKKIRDAKDQFSAFITEIVENEKYRNR